MFLEVEKARIEVLRPPVEKLIATMQVAGVADAIGTFRTALAAGPTAAELPLMALAAGVDPVALAWIADVEALTVALDLADGLPIRHVIFELLDVIEGEGRPI